MTARLRKTQPGQTGAQLTFSGNHGNGSPLRKLFTQVGPPRGGFTFVELLVVIAGIAVLAGVLLLALSKAKGQARWKRCTQNLKQIGLATTLYAEDNNHSYFHEGGSIPNDGQWTLNPLSAIILIPNHPLAYWAIGYLSGNGTGTVGSAILSGFPATCPASSLTITGAWIIAGTPATNRANGLGFD